MDCELDFATNRLKAAPAVTREMIERAEAESLKLPQVECSVIHRFGPGLYIREVSIPAGTFAIGHEQKTRHMNIMLKGRVTILNADGSTSELVAPMMFVGEPGRKCGFIHEDMVWQNIYATTETDIEKLEAMYLNKTQTFEDSVRIERGMLLLKSDVERSDFDKMLAEFGFTAEEARRQAETGADQIPFPFGGYKVMVSDSRIEGKGLFATASIEAGEVIAPARINSMRTPAGRYTNHSPTPNAKMVMRGEDIDLVSITSISGCKGGQLGEEITVDYRQALRLQIGKDDPCQP